MIEIKELLLRFGDILNNEEIKIETIREIISRVVNFQLKKEEIEIKNGTVFLNIKPIYKNEIYLKKENILKEIKNSLGKRAPSKII